MQIPGYEILEKLGEGGTATVWKARQVALDRTVALKILNHAMAADTDAAERFRTEGLAAAKLSHRNIVQVFDAGEVDGQPYFAMEFVEGESLGDLIARKGKMNVEQSLAAAESVAIALKYAWDRAQIIHCDVKPDNVLIDSDGTVKVADLGLARILSHREGHAERDVIGTPNYVSPEQAQGGIELDFRSDIYSLGATLYHLVTGTMPFSSAAGAGAMDAHITEFLSDPVELNPGIPPATAWLIEKMMVRNPADRYASWSSVIDDLDAVINGRMPQPPLPETGQSTVARSAAREALTTVAAAPKNSAKKVMSLSRKSTDDAEQSAGSPNLAVNKEKMRAKLDSIAAKREPTPRNPKNVILPVATAAVVVVICFWLLMQRGSDGLTNFDRVMGRKPAPRVEPNEFQGRGPGETVEEGATSIGGTTPYIPPRRTSNELRVIHNSAMYGWTNASYVRATAQYNNSLRAWVAFTEGKESPNNLKRIEYSLKQAIEYYEKCKPEAQERHGIPDYLSKCSNLLVEVRGAMTTAK